MNTVYFTDELMTGGDVYNVWVFDRVANRVAAQFQLEHRDGNRIPVQLEADDSGYSDLDWRRDDNIATHVDFVRDGDEIRP